MGKWSLCNRKIKKLKLSLNYYEFMNIEKFFRFNNNFNSKSDNKNKKTEIKKIQNSKLVIYPQKSILAKISHFTKKDLFYLRKINSDILYANALLLSGFKVRI